MNSVLVYDTGALIAAERNDRRVWLIHKRALQRDAQPVVPAGVVTESWRGNSPSIARFLKGTAVEALTDERARRAGELLANVSDIEAVDAMVVETAFRRAGSVVTSNHKHLTALAAGADHKLDLIHV
jgi:hypothetical protein